MVTWYICVTQSLQRKGKKTGNNGRTCYFTGWRRVGDANSVQIEMDGSVLSSFCLWRRFSKTSKLGPCALNVLWKYTWLDTSQNESPFFYMYDVPNTKWQTGNFVWDKARRNSNSVSESLLMAVINSTEASVSKKWFKLKLSVLVWEWGRWRGARL